MMKSVIAGDNGAMYEHIAAEEHRLELERTREELHTAKKQLTDRDAELLQLKTAHRKLQDALRKKDKDLQNVFAVLRAPQDAELTKKRKTELVERLLTETQQRVVNAEAVAEERRRELEKLRFSSKFLRNQELEVEIEECYTEIERLRIELSQYAVVGKLKVSRTPINGSERAKTPLKPARRAGGCNQHAESIAIRDDSVAPALQRTVQAVKPLPLQPVHKKESFVDKTRRAVELEYSKQLRLAELEAECELEENLRIRAKREAQAHADARRRKSQEDMIKGKKAAVAAAIVKAPEPAVVAVVDSEAPVEGSTQFVATEVGATASMTAAQTTPAPDEKVPSNAALIQSDESATDSRPVNVHPEAAQDETVDATVAAMVEEVVNVVEHEPWSVVATAPEAQQPKQYDDDDFDDGVDRDDGSDSESIADEASVTIPTVKPVAPAVEKGEEELDEEVDEDSIEKPTPVKETPVVAPREEVYDADEEPDEAVQKTQDAATRQGFVIDVETRDHEEWEVYDLPHPEHRQGFLVAPTYDSGASTARESELNQQEKGTVECKKTSPREGHDGHAEENSYEDCEKAVVVESPEGDDDCPSEEAKPGAPVSREEPDEQATIGTTNEEHYKPEVKVAREAEPKHESMSVTATREEAAADVSAQLVTAIERIEEVRRSEESRETTDAEDRASTDHVDSSGSDISPASSSSAVFLQPPLDNAAHAEEFSIVSDSVVLTATEHASPTPTATEEEIVESNRPPDEVAPDLAHVSQEVAQTIHECNDAIDAATGTIHRQIHSALADVSSPSTTDTSSLTDTNTELTQSELAAAMDSAARKIQRFWREMEKKFAPVQVEATPTPRSTHSGESTPVESAESPVVSETDSW